MSKTKVADFCPPLPEEIPAEGIPAGAIKDSESSGDSNPLGPIQPIDPIIRPLRALKCGCYLVNYTPTGSFLTTYDGTIRVECHTSGRTASGDLYKRPVVFTGGLPRRLSLASPPNPSSGIPIFSRSKYKYYLRITSLLENHTFANSFTLGFEMYKFSSGSWVNEGSFTAKMTWMTVPAGYPAGAQYLEGDVKNSSGNTLGRLKMGWVSSYLRKATVEIDCVSGSEAPINNGSGVDWAAVGNSINWQITALTSNNNVAEPSGNSWSDAEMHAAMLARRDSSNLDSEWRYHILAVKNIDSTPRGIMYDAYSADSNNVPREGIGIASHWTIPNTASWGSVAGMRFGTALKPYYRTAVHEIGHAMGLYHNTVDNGYMNTTDVIAASATAATPFPDNIIWNYASNDRKRLKHYPDPYIRPGGTAFGSASETNPPISPTDENAVEQEELLLTVEPLLTSVPLGAPVRINIALQNVSEEAVEAPASLSLKSGFIKGRVTEPSGNVKTFSPLVLCVEEEEHKLLKPGESVTDSLTLLRGGQGALFPSSGIYKITVYCEWDVDGVILRAEGSTDVMVTPVIDSAHSDAALKVLSTPDTLLTLALGGDHIKDGIDAVNTALKNKTLRPHYEFIEAKRVGEKFLKRKADLKKSAQLINEDTVMSPAEVKKAAKLLKKSDTSSADSQKAVKTLKTKITELNVSDEVSKLVKSL